MFSFLKFKIGIEDISNDDELFVYKRTVETISKQLSSAPFDPSLVSPSPFVFGYIHGLADNCRISFFDSNGGKTILKFLSEDIGLSRVAEAIQFHMESKPIGSGAFPKRDLSEYIQQGYRAGDSDFIVQQIHALGEETGKSDNNLIRYLTVDEMSYYGMGMNKTSEDVFYEMEEPKEKLERLKLKLNDKTPIKPETF